MNNAKLFFETDSAKKKLPEVLKEVQEYISGKYSSLISDRADEQKEQIKSYISKYLVDYGMEVDGYTFDELVDRLILKWQSFRSSQNIFLQRMLRKLTSTCGRISKLPTLMGILFRQMNISIVQNMQLM